MLNYCAPNKKYRVCHILYMYMYKAYRRENTCPLPLPSPKQSYNIPYIPFYEIRRIKLSARPSSNHLAIFQLSGDRDNTTSLQGMHHSMEAGSSVSRDRGMGNVQPFWPSWLKGYIRAGAPLIHPRIWEGGKCIIYKFWSPNYTLMGVISPLWKEWIGGGGKRPFQPQDQRPWPTCFQKNKTAWNWT